MLILMNYQATDEEIEAVCRRVRDGGFVPHRIPGTSRTAIGITGNQGAISPEQFMHLAGVSECIPVSKPYKLVGWEHRSEPTMVEVRGSRIGAGEFTMIAGPCSVESHDQIFRTAEVVSSAGAKFLRGGAYKPRTSPYAFQGLKEEGLRLLEAVRKEFDLRIVTEAKDTESLPGVAEVADVIQVGARNMQNFSLIEACGRLRKPILLKRGISATLQELFMAAEYMLSLGNSQVVFCERGIRTFETMTRNTLDLSAVVLIKHHSHLPVIVDPSHGVGINWAVGPLARAAVVAGADGVMVEVHPDPDHALSDGQQALRFDEFRKLASEMKELAAWTAAHRDGGELQARIESTRL